jgi:lipopolysaccharide exporter
MSMSSSLKNSAIKGGKWSSISALIIVLLQILQITFISRILDPASLGIMSMIMVIIGFAQTFSDMGISSAIIQRKDPTNNQLSSLYWLNIFAGIVVFLIIFCGKQLIGSFYPNYNISDFLSWISVIFLIIPFGQQFQILLQKELKFKELAFISIISTFVATVVTIICAYFGYGVYSLIWGQLINSAVSTAILIYIGWRNWKPKFHFKRDDLKGYLSFGLYQMGEKTVTYFNNNLDNIMIGRFLGAEALGYYTIAYNLIIIPLTKINPIVNKVAFPVFSKIQGDNEKIKNGYMRVINLLSFVNFPIYFGLFLVSPLLVPIMFGEKWNESIMIIQILCGVGLLRTIANPAGSLVMAKGRADMSFMYNTAKTLFQIPFIYLGAHYGGVVGVAIAFLGLKVFYFPFNYFIMIRYLIGPCFKDFVTSMRTALFMSSGMAICVWIVGEVVTVHSKIAIITTQVMIGAIAYIVLGFFFKPELIKQIKGILKVKSAVERRVSN